MNYPHRRYLLFLVSRRLKYFEIAADCTSKQIQVPSEDDVNDLMRELKVPFGWSGTYAKAKAKYKRWLRDAGLVEFWKGGRKVEQALLFLLSGYLRKDFEALTLVHSSDLTQVRKEMLVKYDERQIPSLECLELYCEYFWNLGPMSPQEIYDYISIQQDREELLPAVRGDVSNTLALLGLQQRIADADLLNDIVQLTSLTVKRAIQEPDILSGSQLAGVSALIGRGIEAAAMRHEIEAMQGGEDMRKRAAEFKLRMIEQPVAIPSIEDLMAEDEVAEPIDVEFEEMDNVRAFPSNG